MKITKYGHCCLLIEENGLRILTDPGAYSDLAAATALQNINIILFTHEHPDHLHVDSLKEILKNNPNAKIITNHGVAKILDEQGIAYQLIEHGQNATESGVLIEGFGEKHADIHETIPVVENTGYFIANRLFYPGDAFTNPGKTVEILALPVAGPWMKVSEAMQYAKEVMPKTAFPVHDGNVRKPGIEHRLPTNYLTTLGCNFVILEHGIEKEF